MKLSLSIILAAVAGLTAATHARLPVNCPQPFDFNADATADHMEVGPDPSMATLRSGGPTGTVLYSFATAHTGLHFANPELGAAALARPAGLVPDLVAGLQVGTETPFGAVVCIDLATGATLWTVPGSQACTIGGAVRTIPTRTRTGCATSSPRPTRRERTRP